MGVEPTQDGAGRPATVLKTAETTGPPPLPRPAYRSGGAGKAEGERQSAAASSLTPSRSVNVFDR